MGTSVDLGSVKGPKGDQGPIGPTGPAGPAGINATTTEVATSTSNGLMSSLDKTNLDSISNNMVVITFSNSSWIINSVGGKTKDSEMRAIIDAAAIKGKVSMPGIITINLRDSSSVSSHMSGVYMCTCQIDIKDEIASNTMKDIYIGININKSCAVSDSFSLQYYAIVGKVASVEPCKLNLYSNDIRTVAYDGFNYYKNLPYFMSGNAVATYTDASHISDKAIYAPGISFMVKPTFLGTGTDITATGMISVVNVSDSTNKLRIMPGNVIRLINHTSTAQNVTQQFFGVKIPVALDASCSYVACTFSTYKDAYLKNINVAYTATPAISLSDGTTTLKYSGIEGTIPANGELLTFISPLA